MPSSLPELQPLPTHIRHIKPGVSTDTLVLAKYYKPDRRGVNGDNGFASGNVNPRLCEEGVMTLKFPNGAGEDGALHRERFQIIKNGKTTAVSGGFLYTIGGSYRPGDEWIEVWNGEPPVGDLLMVATPTQALVTPSEINLNLQDAFFLLRKTRETAAGFWCQAPRDVFEYYSGVWTAWVADGFETTQRAFAYSTSAATSSDGIYTFLKAETDFTNFPGVLQLRPSAAVSSQYVRTVNTIDAGAYGNDDTWRMETTVRLNMAVSNVMISLQGTDIMLGLGTAYTSGGRATANGYTINFKSPVVGVYPARVALAIEQRRRWFFFYVNNSLVATIPAHMSNTSGYPQVWHDSVNANERVQIESFLLRKRVPFLMRSNPYGGDWVLPGALNAAGLQVDWFETTDVMTRYGQTLGRELAFSPTGPPAYANKVVTNLANVGGPPSGIQPSNSAVRATGSLYLDFANYDYKFRVTYTGQALRFWLGRTNYRDVILQSTTGGTGVTSTTLLLKNQNGMKAQAGWFPMVLELVGAAAGLSITAFEYQRSDDAPTTWTAVGGDTRVLMSPLGIWKNVVRFESHYDQIQAMKDAFGLQWKVAPASLESGNFPGIMNPSLRVGRDTAKKVDSIEATDIQTQISAENVADALIVDGSGISDPAQKATVVVETINFAEVGNHLLVHQDYESLSDIAFPDLLEQRANSLLALRGAPWEQVDTKPRGYRELLDKFPLSGSLAEFKWEPGDAVRLDFPEVGVQDAQPRQILGVSRDFQPDGVGPPTVSFRQSPRGWAEYLARLQRQAVNSDRNYQGEITTIMGGLGSNSASYAPAAYSYCAMPPGLQFDVVKAYLNVIFKNDTSAWTIQAEGVNAFTITQPGKYDVTDWIKGAVVGSTSRYTYATLGAGGTGTWIIQLELQIKT